MQRLNPQCPADFDFSTARVVHLNEKEDIGIMSYHFPPELDKLVKQQMGSGVYGSEDELLLAALRTLEDKQADWAAVEESLNTLDRGEQGHSLEDAFGIVRRRHNIPQDA